MKKLLVFVVLLAVGVGAAYHFGLLEGLGLRVRFIPKDAALLAYLAPETQELVLVNTTAPQHVPVSREDQEELLRNVEKIHEKTGIHTLKDIDALAFGGEVGVARGRFDWSRFSLFLQSKGFTLTEVGGVPAALNPKGLGLALDGHYLLAGTREGLEKALARKRQGQGMGPDSPLVKGVDELGWKHILVGVLLDGSPLAKLLEGFVGLQAKALLVTLDAPAEGLELRSRIDTGDKQRGEALLAKLTSMRAVALLGSAMDTSPEGRAMRESLEKSTLEADAQGRVSGLLRVPYALVEQASKGSSRSKATAALSELDKTLDADTPTPPGTSQPPFQIEPPPAAPTTLAAPAAPSWEPPVLALVLLTLALATMGAQTRLGLFNVLFHPLFLLPFLLSTVGVFVFRWTGHAGGVFDVLSLPMPEWHRLVSFPVAQPLMLSAALPLLFALLSLAAPWLRPFASGLAMGFSAWLAVRALGHPPLALIPAAHLLPWYVGNALAALVLARLTLPSRQRKESKAPARRP